MPKHSVSIPGHTLEIDASIWNASERIRCDGQTVSEQRSFFYITPHSFSLQEGDERATYEVNILTSWLGLDYGYIVRRNGIILAHRP